MSVEKRVQASRDYLVSVHGKAVGRLQHGYVWHAPAISEAFLAGVAFERKRYVDDPHPDDVYMLQSIYRQLVVLRELCHKMKGGVSLGSEVLADNIDWLDCFIDKHGGKTD